jgi:hypothetical protein
VLVRAFPPVLLTDDVGSHDYHDDPEATVRRAESDHVDSACQSIPLPFRLLHQWLPFAVDCCSFSPSKSCEQRAIPAFPAKSADTAGGCPRRHCLQTLNVHRQCGAEKATSSTSCHVWLSSWGAISFSSRSCCQEALASRLWG